MTDATSLELAGASGDDGPSPPCDATCNKDFGITIGVVIGAMFFFLFACCACGACCEWCVRERVFTEWSI